ncbi:hypothetical protein RZS08_19650, partial [Arthrospira platensis SPKY1]|nr:hypothetical protein [Arthrospira platensis SPKY1]
DFPDDPSQSASATSDGASQREGEAENTSAPAPQAAQEQYYTIDGRRYTAIQVAQDAELMSKLVTHHNQVRHEVELRERAREERDHWKNRALQNEAQRSQETFDPAKYHESHQPVIKALVERGVLTEDSVELVPDIAAIASNYLAEKTTYGRGV